MKMVSIRRYLISGLLVWVPIWITLLIIEFIVNLMDGVFRLLPARFQPDHLLGFHIPGLGLIFTILVVFITGIFAANFLGKHLVHLWDRLIAKIPLVRTIHASVKKLLETVLNSKSHAFRKVLLIEYPNKNIWTIAFQTAPGNEQAEAHLGEDLVTVFVPTTPNPTSGFIMMVPKKRVYELNMSVEQAMKMVISLGVMQPTDKGEE